MKFLYLDFPFGRRPGAYFEFQVSVYAFIFGLFIYIGGCAVLFVLSTSKFLILHLGSVRIVKYLSVVLRYLC